MVVNKLYKPDISTNKAPWGQIMKLGHFTICPMPNISAHLLSFLLNPFPILLHLSSPLRPIHGTSWTWTDPSSHLETFWLVYFGYKISQCRDWVLVCVSAALSTLGLWLWVGTSMHFCYTNNSNREILKPVSAWIWVAWPIVTELIWRPRLDDTEVH